MQLNVEIAPFLAKEVYFYQQLSPEKQNLFVEEVIEFLEKIEITPINTTLKDEDRILIAAAAVIPIFNYPHWFYNTLDEVIVYDSSFNPHFKTTKSAPIQGMVGNRFLNNKLLLSKKALRGGFNNKTDKNNTAIHEFIHLIDKEDGIIDGIPEIFMKNQELLPWVDLMYAKIKEIKAGESDINVYGATNEAEFLSVAAEYFFERPLLLKRKHPQLYEILDRIFNRNKG